MDTGCKEDQTVTGMENQRSRLRVLFFESGESGGSVRCLGEMIDGLVGLGCEVGLVTHFKQTGSIDLDRTGGVQFRRSLDLAQRIKVRPEVAIRRFGVPCPTAFAMKYFVLALRALREFRPHVAYFNNEIESSIPAALAAKFLRIPTICHLRIARRQHRIERLCSPLYDQLIVLTEAGLQIVRASNIPVRKLRQIYDPFDYSTFVERAAEPYTGNIAWDNNCVYVVHVGTLNSRKRPILALDAFAYAHARCPNLRMVFAGSGPLLDTMKQAITDRRLNGLVYLLGDCTEIPALLRRCDIGLFVSAREGTGLVILEFMASSLPVVTWDLPVFVEVGVNAETGIVAAGANAEYFGEALVKLGTSAELRRTLGANGHRRIREDCRFYPETHIHEVYDMLVKTARMH